MLLAASTGASTKESAAVTVALLNATAADTFQQQSPTETAPQLAVTPLSAEDAVQYQQAFAALRDGAADRALSLASAANDPVLLPIFAAIQLQQQPDPAAIRQFVADFPDLAVARSLARQHNRLYAEQQIAVPARQRLAAMECPTGDGQSQLQAEAALLPAERPILRYLQRGDRAGATEWVQSQPSPAAGAAVVLAAAHFYAGDSAAARTLLRELAPQSGRHQPLAYWIAGLSAFQEQDFADAARYFQAGYGVTRLAWDRAAFAFWAARSLKRSAGPGAAQGWWQKAAAMPHSFYGLAALAVLERPLPLDFTLPSLTEERQAALAAIPAGARALALLQLGEVAAAEEMLLALDWPQEKRAGEAMLALADRFGMAELALRLGERMRRPDGGLYDAALFPLPVWRPLDGPAVDPALLLAVMRQESRFVPDAGSHRGARGLMQLMPRTARAVARLGDDLPADRTALQDPVINITLGQRYVQALAAHAAVQGNLLHLLAAYNGGPGNLERWQSRQPLADPFLFIERIPLRETRDYVERVLTFYWIYRQRLGDDTAPLQQLTRGEFPLLPAVDQTLPTDEIAVAYNK